MAVRLLDIAKREGTTPQTVSHVLNNRATKMRISKDLELRIKRTAQEMNYRPNRMAQSLRHQRSKTIGLVSPSLEREATITELEYVQRNLWHKGFKVLVGFSGNDLQHECEILAELRAMCVDGIILFPSESSRADQLDKLIASLPPMLLVNPPVQYRGHWVRIDIRAAMRQAVSHLIEQGHRRIGCVGIRDHLYLEQERIKGIADAFDQAGLAGPAPEDFSPAASPGEHEDQYELGYQGAATLWRNDRGYTAFVARTDQIAIGAMRWLAEHGVDVPRQIAVLGYNGLPVAKYCSPALTTLGIPVQELSQSVVDFILKLIDTPIQPRPLQKVLHGELVVRESTCQLSHSGPLPSPNLNP